MTKQVLRLLLAITMSTFALHSQEVKEAHALALSNPDTFGKPAVITWTAESEQESEREDENCSFVGSTDHTRVVTWLSFGNLVTFPPPASTSLFKWNVNWNPQLHQLC